MCFKTFLGLLLAKVGQTTTGMESEKSSHCGLGKVSCCLANLRIAVETVEGTEDWRKWHFISSRLLHIWKAFSSNMWARHFCSENSNSADIHGTCLGRVSTHDTQIAEMVFSKPYFIWQPQASRYKGTNMIKDIQQWLRCSIVVCL